MQRKTADPLLDLELPCDRPVRGRPSVDQVAAEAEKALEALKEQYDDLAANDIERLQKLLKKARVDPTTTEEALGQIFAVSHDIKGQAATFGYPLLTEVAALLCDFLRHNEGPFSAEQSERMLSVAEAHIQALDVVLSNKVRERVDGQEVLQALTALIARVKKQSQAG